MGVVSAQTAAPSGTLYHADGTVAGSATATVSGASLQVTASLSGAMPGATYYVCVSAPTGVQTFDCAGPAYQVASYTPINGLSVPILNSQYNNGMTASSFVTDSTGVGTVSLSLPEALPVVTVTVANAADPSDSSQTVINTGASAPSACVGMYGTSSFMIPTLSGC